MSVDSFEELGVGAELVASLAAEGIERPTALQEIAIPVVRRGHNVVLAAGPGGGTLVAWGVPLLERMEPAGEAPRALVVTPSVEVGARLAESLGLLAMASGHVVAALGTPWALPGRADVLFGTTDDLTRALDSGDVTAEHVEAFVLADASGLAELEGFDGVETLLQRVPPEAQRVVTALPVTPAVTDFARRHVKRSMTVPPVPQDASPARGTLTYEIALKPWDEAVLSVVARALDDGARHALVFCRSEDRAADVGDYLTLRGFQAGAPGEADFPVWLGVDALDARARAAGHEGVMVVSADVPADPDDLDRRHGLTHGGVVIVLPREVEHLRDVASRTGYALEPAPAGGAGAVGEIAELRDRLADALREEDIAAYLLALEPLFERHHPAEVAAAAVALLRRSAHRPALGADQAVTSAPRAEPAWAKLFLSVGERDGLKPGDLLGAITGEAHVPGESVGRIEIRESHTVVEVPDDVARSVIRALNGTTIRGRAVRADFDRPRRGAKGPGAEKARSGAPRGRRPPKPT